jgi:AcrR family transcriptional regulator
MTRAARKQAMEERILQTADRLFYRQGIRAVGVDTVAAAIGISKRTLYNHFPSKDALVLGYLGRRFWKRQPSDAPPLDQILGDFDRLERFFASAEFRGCPFVNAVAELGEPGHAANTVANRFKEQRRLWFKDLVAKLGVADPDGLATQLQLLVEGAIATALVRGDPRIARRAREAARTLIEAAGSGTGKLNRPAPRRRFRRTSR